MSRSEQSTTMNPSTRWFEWSGSEGKLKYWDKEAKENVFVDLPFTFLVLDQLSTITGYSDDSQSGLWSNEVRDVRKQPFTVRSKAGIAGQGLYDVIKGKVNGAKYTKSIYIAYREGEELRIGNLKAHGACLTAWIEFCKGRNVLEGAITLKGSEKAKKGATTYYVPVFEAKNNVSEETEERAKSLDKTLQSYLREYFDASHNETPVDDYSGIEADPFEGERYEEMAATASAWKENDIPF